MSRKATGNAYQSRGYWFAQVSLGEPKVEGLAKRPSFRLEHVRVEGAARERARVMSNVVRALRGAKRL